MKKKALCALVVLLCCWAVDATASTLTEDEALQIVKNSRIVEGLSNTDVNFYIAEVDTIINNYRCPVDVNTITEAWVTDNTPKWLVFVDEEPLKIWSHACKYYYVDQLDRTDTKVVHFIGLLPPDELRTFTEEQNVVVDNSNIPQPIFRSTGNLIPSVGRLNELADSTYIVLASTGQTENEDLIFLRDISLVYQMLTNVYAIDKSHIRIVTYNDIGGDGIDTMYETIRRYDIDNDGEYEDIICNGNYILAVKEFLNVNNYPDCKHFFLFHDNYFMSLPTGNVIESVSQIDQWHNTYDGNRFLNVFSTGGWGNIADIYPEDNKVITNLRFYDQNSYDHLRNRAVVDWVNALTQYNVFSGDPVNSDFDNNGYISMAEAALYTSQTHNYPINCTSLSTGLETVLSFNRCPISPKLTIKDNPLDNGDEPNLTGATWNSPDIWHRNQDDGVENQISESSNSDEQYVYIRVHNNSDLIYEGYGQKIYLAIADLDTPVFDDSELESVQFTVIDSIPIYQQIPARGSAIVKYYIGNFIIDNDRNSEIIAVVGYREPDYFHDSMYGVVPPMPTPKEDNCLAVSVLNVFDPTFENSIWILDNSRPIALNRTCHGKDFQLSLGNVTSIEIKTPDLSTNDRGAFTIGIETPITNDVIFSGFRRDSQNRFILNSNSASIESQSLANSTLTLKCYDNGMIPISDKKFCFDVIFKFNNDIVGGTSFLLTSDGNGEGGGTIIMMSNDNDNINLLATNLPERTSVQWLGQDNERIGEGEVLSIEPDKIENLYTMIATEDETGRIAIDSIDLTSFNSIKGVSVDGNNILIDLLRPATNDTYVLVTDMCNTGNSIPVKAQCGENRIVIQDGNTASGIKVISLKVNNQVIDSYSFTK